MLVTLPFVLLLLDVWPLGRLRIGEIRSVRELWPGCARCCIEKIPFFVLSIASSAVTVYAQQGSLATLQAVSVGRRVANALVSYVIYLGKTFWPAKLAVFYPLPLAVPLWKTLAAGALLAAITALALWRLRRQPYLAVGWLWFLGMLVPVIGLRAGGPAGDGRPLHVSPFDRSLPRGGLGGGGAGFRAETPPGGRGPRGGLAWSRRWRSPRTRRSRPGRTA